MIDKVSITFAAYNFYDVTKLAKIQAKVKCCHITPPPPRKNVDDKVIEFTF